MASFDQNVPQTAPDPLAYTRLFHPIETPKPDESKATLISGITQALDVGVTSANKTMEEYTTNVGKEAGAAEQDKFLSQITSLTDAGDKQNVPGAVSNGLNFVARNQDAYNQGKLRETEYLRNLYEKAKALRSQYPTYSDYIDKGIEKATGITPNANRLIASILQDINDKKSKDDKYNYKVWSDLAQSEYPGADKAANALKNGAMSIEDATTFLNKSKAIDYQHKVLTSQIAQQTLEEGSDRIAQSKAGQFISQQMPELFSSAMSNLTVNLSEDPNIPGSGKQERIVDILDQATRGERPEISQDQMRSMARMVQAEIVKTMNYANAQNGTTTLPGGKSIRAAASDKYESFMKTAMDPAMKLLESFTNGETGWTSRNAKAVEDMVNDRSWAILNDKDYAGVASTNAVIHKLFGDQYATEVSTKLLGMKGLYKTDANSIERLVNMMATRSSFKGYSEPVTMSKALDMSIKGSGDGAGIPNPKAVDAVVRLPAEMITSPTTPPAIKKNLVTQTFSAPNLGDLKKIEMDWKDPKTQQTVTGRYGAYGYLTSPAVKAEVDKLSGMYGPELKEMHKNWAEYEFDRDLFGEDIQSLAQLSHQPNMKISMTNTPEGLPQFVLYRLDRQGKLTDGSTFPDGVQFVIQRMNAGVQGLGTVHGDPEYTKAYVARTMLSKGVTLDGDSVASSLLRTLSIKKPQPKDQPSASDNK